MKLLVDKNKPQDNIDIEKVFRDAPKIISFLGCGVGPQQHIEIIQRRLQTLFHTLKEGSGNILGFKIVGGITKKQKKQICKVLENQIRESGKIRLLLVIEPHREMDAESLLFDLNFTLTYSDKIERMAIIGNKVWENTWVALFGLFSHIRTQYFDRSEIKAAWKWIQS